MTILFAYMTITLQLRHGSLFRGSAVMSLQFTKSAPLPAEAGCKKWERIVLILVFVASQSHGNKGSLLKKVTAVGVLPYVTVERRHHWRHDW